MQINSPRRNWARVNAGRLRYAAGTHVQEGKIAYLKIVPHFSFKTAITM